MITAFGFVGNEFSLPHLVADWSLACHAPSVHGRAMAGALVGSPTGVASI